MLFYSTSLSPINTKVSHLPASLSLNDLGEGTNSARLKKLLIAKRIAYTEAATTGAVINECKLHVGCGVFTADHMFVLGWAVRSYVCTCVG